MGGVRRALIVANDEYADAGLNRLGTPSDDAQALAGVLVDPAIGGFDVEVLHNTTAQGMRVAIEDFFADRRPEDLLLVHFSCHGLKNPAGELFLAASDTRPTRLASTALAADFVNQQMADSRAQRIALFLDCCYGGAFPRGMVIRAGQDTHVRDAFAGQADISGGRGRVVVTASSAIEYAFEGDRLAEDAEVKPSVFTNAVVAGLTTGDADRDGDGWVGLGELFTYVTDRVRRVTPHQTPHMWTFGAQGDLLIARSRVRRIAATPLPAELLEAMDSPLTATRFGVVDELRERVHGADLGQAYASWQALQRMVDDDSRKVSEAARAALDSAALRVAPTRLDLQGFPASGELRLDGPPLATSASVTTDASWLRVDQDGPLVCVSSEPAGPGDREAMVTVRGPTGEVGVRVRTAGQAPYRADSRPETRKKAKTKEPTPVAGADDRARGPERRRLSLIPAVPVGQAWWPLAALAVAAAVAAVLLYVNLPTDDETPKLWYDEANTGLYLHRSWYDGYFLAAVAALAATAACVWRALLPVGLGIIAGVALMFLVSGVLITVFGLADSSEVSGWGQSMALAGVLLVVVVAVAVAPALRTKGSAAAPHRPDLLASAAAVVGLVALLVGFLDAYTDSEFEYRALGMLPVLVTAALTGVVLLGTGLDPPLVMLIATSVATFQLFSAIGLVHEYVSDVTSSDYFKLTMVGCILVFIGVVVAAVRRPTVSATR